MLSADRPEEWVDQGVRARPSGNVVPFPRMCAMRATSRSVQDDLARHHADRRSRGLGGLHRHAERARVHLNVPFTEPLYGAPGALP